MVPPGPKTGRMRLLAAVIILFTAASSLYARGGQEGNVLARADRLIADREYDEAARILSEFMSKNPNQFEEAQKRMKRIINIRARYNQVANELLDVVETRPDDSDKIMALSDELLSIENPSNPATRRFLDQIRYLAEFRMNSGRLERILITARYQLSQNNYSAAMATYASGLDIYQELYFSSGYGAQAENVARSGLETIERNIRGFNALQNPVSLNAGRLAAVDRPEHPSPAEASRLLSELSPLLDQLTALQESFQQVKNSFDVQHAVNQRERDESGDRSFLSFAGMLLSGPADMREGMIGALKQFWDFRVSPTESALINLAGRSYNSGFEAMMGQNYPGSVSAFNTADLFITIALEQTRRSNRFLGTGNTRNHMIYGELVNEERAGNYLSLRIMSQAIGHLRSAGNLANRNLALERAGFPALASWQSGAITAQAAISQEQAVRQSYQSLISELGVLEERVAVELSNFNLYRENLPSISSGGIGSPQKPLTDAGNLTAALNSRFRAMEYNSAIRYYTIAVRDMESRAEQRQIEFNEGNSLVSGLAREAGWGEIYTAYYPTEGLAILTRMNSSLETDIRETRALVDRFAAEDQSIIVTEEMSGLYSLGRDLLARLLALQSTNSALMASARQQVQQAASLRHEGDRLFQAAQASLNRNDFESARNFLTRATDQYRASRNIQESDSLRATWNTQVVGLNADIDRRENEVIVQYVREQVTRAQTQYFAGNIDQAETALVNAQNRWRITNTTEQPEVEYWLGLVRGALSLQSGRTIAATAPLFAEMSQLLSDARRNYDEGVRLLNSGRRREGLARFNDAMEKTREVRIMFPLNHDARMIELRIEQQTDQAAFNTAFQRRLNEAIAGTRPNVRNPQSFAELQDLAEINPRYPGIAAIITQAEIDMGYRPPPPNPRDLARSTELTRSAQTNFNSRDSTRISLARTELEQAVLLNPNNSQAQRLLDQVLISLTGTGTIAIPQEIQDQYDVAFRMHTQGNYLQADAVLQRLLQNPANQRYTIILELKRRNDVFL